LLRVYLGERFDSATGKKKRSYKNETFHGTEPKARKRLREMLGEKDGGNLIATSKMTLDQHLDDWLQRIRRRIAARTLENYTYILKQYVRPHLGGARLANITFEDLEVCYDNLMELHGLSARTVLYAHGLLRQAFFDAVKRKRVLHSPTVYAEKPTLRRTKFEVLSEKEAPVFLELARPAPWGALFTLALTAGLRPEEYFGLGWDCLYIERGLVSVQRTLVHLKGGWVFGEPKTERSRRIVKLPPDTIRALLDHKKAQAEEKLKAGPNYHRHNLVFANAVGAPLDKGTIVDYHYRPLLKRAGVIKHLRLYDLRHSFATLSLLAGVHPKVVSEALGHASVAFTMDTYAHVLPTMQDVAVEKIGELLFGTSAEGPSQPNSAEFAHISHAEGDDMREKQATSR
jgi:integrase